MSSFRQQFRIALLLSLLGSGYALGDSARTHQGPYLIVQLTTRNSQPQFDVKVRNSDVRTVAISYNECDFSYQLKVGSRTLNYPKAQPFAFASPCPGELLYRKLAPGTTAMLFSQALPLQATQLLQLGRNRYEGEFHFRFAVIGNGRFTTSVYRLR